MMLKVFGHLFPSHTLQQVAFDALLLFIASLLAILMQFGAALIEWELIVPSAFLFAVTMIFLNSAMGLYRAGSQLSRRDAFARVILAVLVSLPAADLAFRVLPWSDLASQAVQLSLILLLGLVLTMRGLANRRQASAFFAPRVLIIGTGSEASAVSNALAQSGESGMEIVGYLSPGEEGPIQVERNRILTPTRGLLETVRRLRVNQVIVAVRERRGGVLPLRELLDCKMWGVKVMDLSSFFEQVQGQVRVDSLKASWLIYGDGFRQGWARTLVKRCFDIGASLVLLALAWPVMLLAAVAVVLEDGGPVFYRQERVGQGGRLFRITKFRSMRVDAEGDGRPRWASSNDDRITRVGRILRKLRIDELPQLFNVLAGDMSLVGPRPERPFFVDQLVREVPFYAVRHCVKPGVTGWAQVRYQYGSSVDDAVQKLQYDLYYVKNHSLVLDVLVLFETVRVVLTGEGAH